MSYFMTVTLFFEVHCSLRVLWFQRHFMGLVFFLRLSLLEYTLGDEVLEWNGRFLQGATFEEVYNIILESKPEPQVELVVSRPIG